MFLFSIFTNNIQPSPLSNSKTCSSPWKETLHLSLPISLLLPQLLNLANLLSDSLGLPSSRHVMLVEPNNAVFMSDYLSSVDYFPGSPMLQHALLPYPCFKWFTTTLWCACHSVFIHPSIGGGGVCFCILGVVLQCTDFWLNTYFPFFWLWIDSVGQVAVDCSLEGHHSVPISAALSCSPIRNIAGFQCFHILAKHLRLPLRFHDRGLSGGK